MRKLVTTVLAETDFNASMTTWGINEGSSDNYLTPEVERISCALTMHINKQETNEANLRSLLLVKKDDLVNRKQMYSRFNNEEGINKILVLQALSEIDDMIFIIDSIIQCR